ncbi:DNA mismatch repair protein MutT [Bacillus sp. FJAT-27225]|uniref:NUDIX hydrolase n=1 Tax=Bacillus sp. FJAT-27225 TaxID=1743144 RepID=UPI00080C2E2F|nr:NUDIX domain-containing protein [Bacillus sp. FJAT-27225]OCA81604.1 DNA mismatch repair protein MutT [Bacillus sp. FJAT-27225]
MFIVNVEGAIQKDGKWLVIRRSEKEEHAGGMLSLVGGKVDVGEPSNDILEITLKREIFEEVGIEIANPQFINSSRFSTGSGTQVINIIFRCEVLEGKAHIKSPDEVSEILWLTTEEILNDPSAPDYLKGPIRLADKSLSVL